MNTIESCKTECPIIQGLELDTAQALLEEHRYSCVERRLGLLGILCGMPGGEEKNNLTRAALNVSRSEALLAV